MKYTVLSWDGVEGTTVTSCLTPGSAAKRAVEELGFRPGHIVVIDEFGERRVFNVHKVHIVYAYEERVGREVFLRNPVSVAYTHEEKE